MRLTPWDGGPDAPALDDGRTRWSRHEVAQGARRGAACLEGCGVSAGRLCATLLHPDTGGVLGMASALASPGAVVPLSPSLTPGELTDALTFLGPAVLVAQPATEARAREALAGLPRGRRPALTLVAGDPPTWRAEGPLRRVTAGDAGAANAIPPNGKLVLWTSGTTGASRAIVLQGPGIVEAARSQFVHQGVSAGERLPTTLPLSSVGGIMVPLRAAWARAVVVPLARFDAADVVARMRAGEAHHLSVVPVMLSRLVERLEAMGPDPLASAPVRTVLVGGAPCPPGLVERALAVGLPVSLTWGMTESCAQAATATPAEVREDPASVGRPLEHVDVRVDDGGRLHLKLPKLAPGELVRRPGGGLDLRELVDAEGWYRTGDLGEIDPNGRIRITGRLSHRIISGGVNVDPLEVERHLEAHPEVAEAVVVGVTDPEWGERVVAAVVRAPRGPEGHETDAAALTARLDAHVRSTLAPAKRPREWRVLPELPRTPAGKVDRRAVARSWPPPAGG